MLFNSATSILLFLFSGVVIPYPDTQGWLKAWLCELNPWVRITSSMFATELQYVPSFPSSLSKRDLTTNFYSGLEVTCNPEDFAVFNPPLNETCATWADDFVQHFGGYLDNPTETALCRYCPVAVGDEYYTPLNMSYENRWRDVWLIFASFGTPPLPPIPPFDNACRADKPLLAVFNGVLVVLASRFLRYARR